MSKDPAVRAHLVLGSRFENIELAERTLLDLVAQTQCDSDEQYWIVTALREAIANAVRHGNREQLDRKVRIDYTIEGRTVTIRVEDEGEGFDLSQVPDPTQEENLLRPNGRGIFYMQQFMSRVEFGRAPGGGTTVVMVRELLPTSRSDDNEERDS
jgi:serine/threonine-protein kinase RsbW